MIIRLQYINGKVEAKRVETGIEYEVHEDGLSDLFRPYYQKMKQVFEKEMITMKRRRRIENLGGDLANNGIDSTLTLDLQLTDLQKIR
ncbi:MAG: hypothetical protein Q7S06_02845 [Nanoarchaeota archaeon]|nr:hypothetical protein [Nanoarchaeota archaeon]